MAIASRYLLVVLALFALSCLLPFALADMDNDDIDDSFSLREGKEEECPNKIELDAKGDELTVTAGEFEILEQSCTGGELRLVRNPKNSSSRGVAYLEKRSEVGSILAGFTTAKITCGVVSLDGNEEFIFAKPDKDITVVFSEMFGTNSALGKENKSFKLDDDNKYLFLGNGRCFYGETRIKDRVCFPGSTMVTLSNGLRRAMRDVEIGDEVMTSNGKTSAVIGWSHRDATIRYRFVRAHTASGLSVTASAGHYIYADGKMTQMRDVRMGMSLSLGSGGQSMVTKISKVMDNGLYNPQTVDGDIVVDGIVASTYTEAIKPMTAHALLAPVRAAYCAVGRMGSSMLMSWA